jgi:hypothetical protein
MQGDSLTEKSQKVLTAMVHITSREGEVRHLVMFYSCLGYILVSTPGGAAGHGAHHVAGGRGETLVMF